MNNANTPLKWVRLSKYCEISGDTADAVHSRRKVGAWLDGKQCKIGPDKKLWVNLPAVDRWVETGKAA